MHYEFPVIGDTHRPHVLQAFSRRHGVANFVNRCTAPGVLKFEVGALWGHTAFYDPERRVFNEALMFRGVVETPWYEWFGRYSAYECVAVPVQRPDLALTFQREQIGKDYDYPGAFAVPFRADWQNPRWWFCSEKDAAALIRAGFDMGDLGSSVHPQTLRFKVAA
ncbi:hypothetical protein HNQ51_001756 [Inhella inkyongensis]|uniref:Uncharacterized protein n=1 Tax=Inhella inkyongensis TaxID=392593 RepID=A0A840S4F8_9BURK|nr:hypothetical protein [Inhella inkyongensis]MBB5204442.1 hypothetical protein [Inhella inkyongensis]